MAGDQAQELIVILGRWGYVYAIINLGACLFAREWEHRHALTRSQGKPVHQKVAASVQVIHCKRSVQGGKHALRMAA